MNVSSILSQCSSSNASIFDRLLSCFFFYSYGDHLDLHSFPTRRSSDLVSGGRRDVAEARAHATRPPPAGYDRRDRKSTRLNSSHTVISYAVFCLKKKNKSSFKMSIKEYIQ